MTRRILEDDTLLIEEKGWVWVEIDANKGNIVYILARESVGDDFDIHIVYQEDVDEDNLWTEHALFTKKKQKNFRGKYIFIESGTYRLVISNARAREIEREVYVKIELETPSRKETQSNETKETEFHPNLSWKMFLVFILLLSIVTVIAFSLSRIDVFIAGALLTVVGIIIRIFTPDLRRALGLEKEAK